MFENEKKRMLELIEEIRNNDYRYYILNAPQISDYEYDQLENELKMLEEKTGIVLAESTTGKMRVTNEQLESSKIKFYKHKHINRLFSLQKSNTYDELRKWHTNCVEKFPNCEFVLEYKFDGFNLCLTYKNGLLATASTRGDGIVGELVTSQVKTIKSIPHKIDFQGVVEIQGEGIMKKSVFEKFNKTVEEKLINERNAAAGAIRNLDPTVTEKRNLDALFYTINFINDNSIKTETDRQAFLIKNKIPTSDFMFKFKNIDDAIVKIEEVVKLKNKLDFQIDGMVIKVDNLEHKERLGYTNKFPRGAIAFKFEAEEKTTISKKVLWQIGRTGKLTPIAELEEVFLAGATIKRATLNNYGDILRKKVKIGSKVLIRRSNEVIPEVLGVYENYDTCKDIEKPSTCPSCGSDVVENGAHLFCENPDCPEIVKGKLVHFCSKKAMNIEGLSDRTIEELFTKLNVREFYDLFDLKLSDLVPIFVLEGEDSKQANNVIERLEKSKNVELWNFLFALSIGGVGDKVAKLLSANFGTLENIQKVSSEELEKIKDIGPIVAKTIVNFFEDEKTIKLLEQLAFRGVVPAHAKKTASTKLSGQTFVITGSFENYSREQLIGLVEENAGKTSSSVSKKTTFVIVGQDAGSKLTKATELGIKTISVDEFLKMLDL